MRAKVDTSLVASAASSGHGLSTLRLLRQIPRTLHLPNTSHAAHEISRSKPLLFFPVCIYLVLEKTSESNLPTFTELHFSQIKVMHFPGKQVTEEQQARRFKNICTAIECVPFG